MLRVQKFTRGEGVSVEKKPSVFTIPKGWTPACSFIFEPLFVILHRDCEVCSGE